MNQPEHLQKMIMKMKFRTWISAAFALWLAVLLCGCGGGDPPIVQYLGTTLVVDGMSYERRTPEEIHGPDEFLDPGVVYVTAKAGQQMALEGRLDGLGLPDRQSYRNLPYMTVRVPTDWEDQWVRALLDQFQVQSSWLQIQFPIFMQ